MEIENNDCRVKFVLVFAVILWGLNPTVVKMGIENLPSIIFITLRLGVSVIAFCSLLMISKSYKPVERKDIKDFILVGLGGFGYQITFVFGLQFTSVTVASIIMALMPISVLLMNRIFYQVKIRLDMIVASVICFIGVIMVMITPNGQHSIDGKYYILGVLLLIISQFSSASYTAISNKLLKKYSHYQVSAGIFIFTFLGFLVVSNRSLITYDYSNITYKEILCILYGSLFSLCIANNLWIWGIKRIGSSKTAIYNNLLPIISLTTGIIVLNEKPYITQIIGMGIVITGMCFFQNNWMSTYLNRRKYIEK